MVTHRAGITLDVLDGYELWEAAAACGLHILPEGEDHTTDAVIAESAAADQQYREARQRKATKMAEKNQAKPLG